jgi:glycosyltransferase 2 family protein
MSILSKRILNLIGSILAILGVVFVCFRLYDYGGQVNLSQFGGKSWGALALLAVVYGAANILLALGWRTLLAHFNTSSSCLKTIQIYGITQLAKYVPGNIMHMASRQAMAVAAGMNGWSVAKASLWEIGLLIFTGACFAILLIPQFFQILTVNWAFFCFIVFSLVSFVALHRFIGKFPARTYLLYLCFLSTSGLVFIGALMVIQSVGQLELSLFTYRHLIVFLSAFVVAWLGGLVTPGAPAGVGVRELILLFLLSEQTGEGGLVVAIVLSRFVSVGGDLLFFLFSGGIKAR